MKTQHQDNSDQTNEDWPASETPLSEQENYYSESTEMNSILTMMEKLRHWAAIIDSSDDAIISKSSEGYITSWNRGAEQLYGYTPEEIIGKSVATLIPVEKEDDFPKIMKQLEEGKKVDHYETKRMTKDGKIIDVSITVSPIKDPQGNIIGASKIARDVSERKNYERRREEFVSTASHELKTPITSQKIFGELLEKLIEENGDEKYKPYIRKVNLQTEKLTKLVTDLLELTQIENKTLKLEKELFYFNDLVKELVTDMQQVSGHEIKITSSFGNKIWADEGRIGQVIMNLLSNAIKYSFENNPIEVSARQSGEFLIVRVKDSGIGISKEFHQKIFDRFFRVSGIDETTYPGMGIGLNFCKEIINRHKGKMWVESEPGKGSEFYFSIPVEDKK